MSLTRATSRVIDPNFNFGSSIITIRSSVPQTNIHPNRIGLLVSAEGTDVGGRIGLRTASSSETPLVIGYRSRGTISAPTAVQASDQILTSVALGYDGSGWFDTARISVFAENNWSATDRSSAMTFSTTTSGSGQVSTERMRISSTGLVGIGTNAPEAALHVNGRAYIHNGTVGVPSTGTIGGNGTRLVLWPGSSTGLPYALGINNNTLWYGTPAGGNHIWYNGTTEVMRLDTSGQARFSSNWIYLTGASPSMGFIDNLSMPAFLHCNSSIFYILRNATVGAETWDSGPNGRHPMTMNLSNGDVTFSGNVFAYSDIRTKKEIKPVENALEKTLQLQGVEYKKLDDTEASIGLVAQDVQKVLPEVVREDKDGYLYLSYGNVVGLLVEATKELTAKVNKLELKVADLGGK